jgi:hypothetical protein
MSFRCGGQDATSDFKLQFILRRNWPQQANVDMATIESTFAATGFQFLTTTSITGPVIDNATYNYYIVATAIAFDVGVCPGCSVGFCRVGYTTDTPYP